MALNEGLQALQQRLGHPFADPALLERAVTHRSFSADHNERLEFLGDSVLNLSVAHWLYEQLNDQPEGDLSRVRANLVKQDTLFQLAVTLELSTVLRLGEGEMRSGGQKRPSILADALEALIGAVYLDAGYAAAQSWREFGQRCPGAAPDPQLQLQGQFHRRAGRYWAELPTAHQACRPIQSRPAHQCEKAF